MAHSGVDGWLSGGFFRATRGGDMGMTRCLEGGDWLIG